MTANFKKVIDQIAAIDLFKRNTTTNAWETGIFIGRPFHLDYNRAHLLVADAWKQKAKGIPQGSFLLAYYENEEAVYETLLLRVLAPTKLPTDNDVISSMIEYYKDNLQTNGSNSQLDSFTRYEFSFSGLECRVLGTFYKDRDDNLHFGADLENFYSAHNYSVIKPTKDVLMAIVNFREGQATGRPTDIQIGKVRYSSSQRFQADEEIVPVYVSPQDYLGKRTALFGMTRTGKSNTVKKIIEASVSMSDQAPGTLDAPPNPMFHGFEENLEPFMKDGVPKYPVGQIIFDINGEYANANLQDAGTAIFELYKQRVTRYSVLSKDGFKVMKVNFYRDIDSGFELIRSHLATETSDYVRGFLSIDFVKPDSTDHAAMTRYERKKAAYLCCLYQAGFKAPDGFKVKFTGAKEINSGPNIDPSDGITLEEASNWFTYVWEQYTSLPFFQTYQQLKGREWADEELKSMLVMLTAKSKAGAATSTISGFRKLKPIARLHTQTVDQPFEIAITEELRNGKIIIVDLSQGDPDIQRLYSERICRQIFAESMARFINAKPNNFIQFYFEEAHNLFPKKDDGDLSQIYNRIAKEGAKLNLGLVYATQEVSSISSNILKNTQNWFISHLNNEDETKEIKKYYDFSDFTDSLVRFSASSDKGFVRMKNYSNPFVVSIQVGRFPRD